MTLKRKAAIALGVVLYGAAMFGAGRFTAPVKVVVTEKKADVQKLDVEQQKVATTLGSTTQVLREDKKKHGHLVKHIQEITLPDGTKKKDTTVTFDTGSDEQKNGSTATVSSTQTAEDTKVHQEHTVTSDKKTETTYARPSLRVSLMTGLDVGETFKGSHGLSLSVAEPKLYFGAQLEKRLFWNIYGGLWGLSNGHQHLGGILASGEF